MLKHNNIPDSVRIDKWLWCARFYKTRRQALDAIKSGKIKSGGNRIKPSYAVRVGEAFSIRRGPFTYEIAVLGLATHRKSASEAALLYEENPESKSQREQQAMKLKAANALMPRSRGRPTKRERRRLIEFSRNVKGKVSEQ